MIQAGARAEKSLEINSCGRPDIGLLRQKFILKSRNIYAAESSSVTSCLSSNSYNYFLLKDHFSQMQTFFSAGDDGRETPSGCVQYRPSPFTLPALPVPSGRQAGLLGAVHTPGADPNSLPGAEQTSLLLPASLGAVHDPSCSSQGHNQGQS